VHEPRRHRQVSVARERTAGVELRDPPQAFGLESATHAFDLDDIVLDRLIGGEPQILGPELVERRPQHPHAREGSEHTFGLL
jgi:hypothetical protein